MTTHKTAPEIKAATGTATEVAEAFDDFMGAFEAFKAANDERLKEIETRVGADVITTEKVDRIAAALDEQKSAMNRLLIGRGRPALSRGDQRFSFQA